MDRPSRPKARRRLRIFFSTSRFACVFAVQPQLRRSLGLSALREVAIYVFHPPIISQVDFLCGEAFCRDRKSSKIVAQGAPDHLCFDSLSSNHDLLAVFRRNPNGKGVYFLAVSASSKASYFKTKNQLSCQCQGLEENM
jgi:hypothetical protein